MRPFWFLLRPAQGPTVPRRSCADATPPEREWRFPLDTIPSFTPEAIDGSARTTHNLGLVNLVADVMRTVERWIAEVVSARTADRNDGARGLPFLEVPAQKVAPDARMKSIGAICENKDRFFTAGALNFLYGLKELLLWLDLDVNSRAFVWQ